MTNLTRRMVAERVDSISRPGCSAPGSGELTEDEFKPLRLMNGLYLQLARLHAAGRYSVWHALPRRQMRRLAHVARKYDKGYGHFTTRQNIQFNWPALVDVPAYF